MTTVFTSTQNHLSLGPEVARGGEGVVWRIRERPDAVAKLYTPHTPPRAAQKLEAMLARRPADPTAARLGHTAIAWPTDPLFDRQGRFIGYAMPGIFDGRPLVDVYNRKRRAQVLSGFDRRYLHRTAANFAVALGALHGHGVIVGDLNESNVLVRPNALVTLIDTDSYQVPNLRGRQPLIFPCPVGKTEFTPPELQGVPFGGAVRTPEHDRFAMGVLIFLLLMEGSHPFRARWLGAGEPASTDQKIAQGLFPYATPPAGPISPPPGAPPLAALHPAIAELMRQCFVDGHKQPAMRPQPAEWERALREGERALVRCPNGHYYGGHLRRCSWCTDPPIRRPVAPQRPGREHRETPPPPGPPFLPAPTVRPLPSLPPRHPPRSAWRNALSVSIIAILVIAMMTPILSGSLLPFGQSGLPTQRAPQTDDNEPFDLQPGDSVRVTDSLREVMLFHEPEGRVFEERVAAGSRLEIVGPWTGDRRGRIWWPVYDRRSDQTGYILQILIEPDNMV